MNIYITLLLSFSIYFTSYAQVSNINLSAANVFDGEPYLGVNPYNTKQVTVAWIGYMLGKGVSIKTKTSVDGGDTWSAVSALPHIQATYHSADPSIAYDDQGNIYICYIDYRQNPDSGMIVTVRSTNAGKTWATPKKAFDLYDNGDRPIDRPWLAIDRSKANGLFCITSKPAPWDPTPNKPYYKISSDQGDTWSAVKNIDSSDFPAGNIPAPMPFPAFASNGKLYIAYPSWKNATSKPAFVLATNTGGANFQRTAMITSAQGSGGDTLSKLGYELMANPADSQNLIFSMVHRLNNDPDIYVISSHDGGANWTAPVRVNDDSINNNRDQEMVWSSFNQQGQLAVAWRDRRSSAGGGYAQNFNIYYAISKDGGLSFGKNDILSSQEIPYKSILDNDGNDFLGLGLAHDTVHAAWGDTRGNTLNIYYARKQASLNIGLEKPIAEEPLIITFPNPTSNQLYISFSSNKPELVEIYNSNGLLVKKQPSQAAGEGKYHCTIDAQQLSSGIYYIQIGNQRVSFARE
jgi:hypothetical protein